MEKNPFDPLFDKIAELLQFAYDNAHKPISDEKAEEIETQLAELEKQVEAFAKTNEKILEESGISDYIYQNMLEDDKTSLITPDEQALLKRAESLKQEAQTAAQDPIKAAENAKAEGKVLSRKRKKVEKPKSPQLRRGKFRSMGGFKNWKPL